jgi:serine/threonine protein kinase
MQVETLPPGTILHGGRYKVERALGSGGFGHVYLSVDLDTQTQYAIKEYLVSGASGKAQLEHEAQVLRQLHHPNLPDFLSSFDERGHYYVVLGYIEGNDLTDYVRNVRQRNEVIPLNRLMGWLLSICDAVAFLHSQHPPIIHRDIKPDNIRITPNGTAILVDLGNAKTAADGARTLFFIRHQGTPGYAPLEQYPGGTGTDERSDVYALGGTLYFALTAHEPPSVSARNQSLSQKQPDLPSLQERLAQNPPDVPQEQRQFRLGVSKPGKPAPRHSRHLAQLGALSPETLRKLDSIIQRAMAMKPKDRYQSVVEFSNELKAVLRSLPDLGTPPTASNREIDPNSTVADLPMNYEALPHAQATNQGRPAQQAPIINPKAPAQQPPIINPKAPAQQVPTINPKMPAQQPQMTNPKVPAQQVQMTNPKVPAQQAQGQLGQAPPMATPAQNAGQAPLRCSRCAKELPPSAPFCPRCGNPTHTRSQPNLPKNPIGSSPNYPSQGSSQKPSVHDVSGDETILMSPHIPPQESADQTLRRNSPISPAQANPRLPRSTSVSPAIVPRQERLNAPSQPAPTAQPQPDPPKSPSPNGHTNVKPFIQSVSSGNNQVSVSVKPEPLPATIETTSSQPSQPQTSTNLAILGIIGVVTLIIVVLIVLVFLKAEPWHN